MHIMSRIRTRIDTFVTTLVWTSSSVSGSSSSLAPGMGLSLSSPVLGSPPALASTMDAWARFNDCSSSCRSSHIRDAKPSSARTEPVAPRKCTGVHSTFMTAAAARRPASFWNLPVKPQAASIPGTSRPCAAAAVAPPSTATLVTLEVRKYASPYLSIGPSRNLPSLTVPEKNRLAHRCPSSPRRGCSSMRLRARCSVLCVCASAAKQARSGDIFRRESCGIARDRGAATAAFSGILMRRVTCITRKPTAYSGMARTPWPAPKTVSAPKIVPHVSVPAALKNMTIATGRLDKESFHSSQNAAQDF
mmetsp:Transcript_61834/g.172690  ORF Transcript_61834/g.172690 Transcript_61834/m.172690 type:complete len:305 (+) Transcript_61834:202-1116(+)